MFHWVTLGPIIRGETHATRDCHGSKGDVGSKGWGRTVWKAKGRLSYPGKGSRNGILWFPVSTQTRLPDLSPFCRRSRWKGCFTGCHRLFNRLRAFCTNDRYPFFRRVEFVDMLDYLFFFIDRSADSFRLYSSRGINVVSSFFLGVRDHEPRI